MYERLEVVEEFFGFTEFEFSTIFDPWFFHKCIVLLVKVDDNIKFSPVTRWNMPPFSFNSTIFDLFREFT